MGILIRMISSHIAFDIENPNQKGHGQDIEDLINAYNNCIKIYNKKCNDCPKEGPPPIKAPSPSQDPSPDDKSIFDRIKDTLSDVNDWLQKNVPQPKRPSSPGGPVPPPPIFVFP